MLLSSFLAGIPRQPAAGMFPRPKGYFKNKEKGTKKERNVYLSSRSCRELIKHGFRQKLFPIFFFIFLLVTRFSSFPAPSSQSFSDSSALYNTDFQGVPLINDRTTQHVTRRKDWIWHGERWQTNGWMNELVSLLDARAFFCFYFHLIHSWVSWKEEGKK